MLTVWAFTSTASDRPWNHGLGTEVSSYDLFTATGQLPVLRPPVSNDKGLARCSLPGRFVISCCVS